jgi:NADH-quinone oxidoreductase chain G
MITINIDGRQIKLKEQVTILEAARSAGIRIPTLCHHDLLKPYGGCRLCLVEVEKVPKLQTSCTLKATDGMVVHTHSKDVLEARKAILEFLLINHPLECPVCDKAGICDLQDWAMMCGPTLGRFAEKKREMTENLSDPLIVRNTRRCIACTRCVRMCGEVQKAYAISMVRRSGRTAVEPFSGGVFDCEYCGNCISVCPVGALTSRTERFTFRPWMVEKEVDTICSFCGVGCNLTLKVRGNAIVGVAPGKKKEVNDRLLCNRGMHGSDFVSGPERIRTPLVRQDGQLASVTWDEALALTASGLKEIKEKYGGDAIAGIISCRCTNEDHFVFRELFRNVLQSDNIDTSSGLYYAYARTIFEKLIGPDAVTHPLDAISSADGIIVLGGDPTSISPVFGLKIRDAAHKGIPVVTVGHMPGFKFLQTIRVAVHPDTETSFLHELVSSLLRERQPEDINPSLLPVLERIGRSNPDISREAAANYGEALDLSARALSGSSPSIVVGPDIVRRTEGHTNLLLIACLSVLTGGKLHLITDLPNEAGAFTFGRGFTGTSVGGNRKLGMMEIFDAAASQGIRALYIMGENVLLSLPDAGRLKKALSMPELVIVQDSFFTETAELAHVLLPSLSWAERDGTYTNMEGRTQRLLRALDASGKEDWKIVAEISRRLGYEMNYNEEKDIFSRMASVESCYHDLSFGNLECSDRGQDSVRSESSGTQKVVEFSFSSKAGGQPVREGAVLAAIDYPLRGWGNMERRSAALSSIASRPYARIGTGLASALSLSEGDRIALSGNIGEIEVETVIDIGVPAETVMVPVFLVPEIMEWKMNPFTKTPVLDTTEIEVRRAL